MPDQEIQYPLPTAQVEPFVEVLGTELTVVFLLEFGGAELYVGSRFLIHGEVAQLLGIPKATALGEISHRLPRRIPLAKQWLSKCLLAEGHSKAAIARKLRVSDVSVRRWLRGSNTPSSGPRA